MKRLSLFLLTIIFFVNVSNAGEPIEYQGCPYGVTFNGINARARVSWPNFAQHSSVTITLWLRYEEEHDGTEKVIVQKMARGPQGNCEYSLLIDEAGQFMFRAITNGGSEQQESVSTSNFKLENDTWYHVAATMDENSFLARIYINGELKATKTLSGPIKTGHFFAQNIPIYVGCSAFSFSNSGGVNTFDYKSFFKGTIDELAIGRKALSPEQIDTIARKWLKEEIWKRYDIVSYYQLKEGVGSKSENVTGMFTGTGTGRYMDFEGAKWVSTKCENNLQFIDPIDLVQKDGTLNTALDQLDLKKEVIGAATDGISKIVVYIKSNKDLKFSIQGFDKTRGFLSTFDAQKERKGTVIGKSNNGVVAVIFTVPESWWYKGLGSYERYTTIIAEDANTLGEKLEKEIKLVTPPVVMVHGMWSNPGVWDDFFQNLKKEGFKNIEKADYSKNAHKTFDPKDPESIFGRSAVYRAIENGLERYKKQKIVASQVDVVAHSLGGLMTRSLVESEDINKTAQNYYQGLVHKLITLGTPHKGSPLGPLLYEIREKEIRIPSPHPDPEVKDIETTLGKLLESTDFKIGSCHRDFDIKSPTNPYENLSNTQTKINKVHAIVSDWKPDESFGHFKLNIGTKVLFDKSHDEVFDNKQNDLIVPLESQLGGLDLNSSNVSFFSSVTHSTPGNVTQTNSAGIFSKVILLLESDLASEFNTPFPRPKNNIKLGKNPIVHLSDISKNSFTTLSNDSALIHLNSASKNIMLKDQTEIVITFEPSGHPEIESSICIIQELGWFPFPDKAPYTIKVPIPANLKSLGRLSYFVAARDVSGLLLADTSSIMIQPKGIFYDLRVEPEALKFDAFIKEGNLSATAVYVNGTDSLYYKLDASSGVSYTTSTSIVRISTDGTVVPISVGSAQIQLTYLGQSVFVPVTVAPSFTTASKFGSQIEFNPKDRLRAEKAFSLNATCTSSEPVTITYVSGPVEFRDGFFVIKDTGLVTVRAAAAGNNYFHQPADITRTFRIVDVKKLSQFIDIDSAIVKTIGDPPFKLRDTSSAGLPIRYQIVSGGATVDGSTITLNQAGKVTLKAYQEGNDNYEAAPIIQFTFCVNPKKPNTILGNSAVCLGTESYSVEKVPLLDYIWEATGATFVAKKDCVIVHWKTTGLQSITVTPMVAGCRGNSNTLDIQVGPIPGIPSITNSGATTLCKGNKVQLRTDINSTSYQWFKDDNKLYGATEKELSVDNEGSYHLVIGKGSCIAVSTPVAIKVLPAMPIPVIEASGATNICIGGNVILESSATAGNQWYRNDTLISGAVNPSYQASVSGNYQVMVTENGCTVEATHPVVVKQIIPSGTIQAATTLLCPGNNILLTASGGASYAWYRNDVSISNTTYAALTANKEGIYSVDIISTEGCRAKAANTINIQIPESPTAAFTFDTYCKDQPVHFNNSSVGSGDLDYAWQFGDRNFSSAKAPTHTYLQTGVYNVSLVVSNTQCKGVADTLSKSITIISPMPNSRYSNLEVVIGKTFQLAARTGGKTYTWKPETDLDNPKSRTPVLKPSGARQYLIVITNEAGCTSTDTLQTGLVKGSAIYFPKAFTPNGDGNNDILKPIVKNITSLQYFRVYNRWGQLVFQTKTLGEGWDGTMKGIRQPVETYTWAIAGNDAEGNPIQTSGKVLLVR